MATLVPLRNNFKVRSPPLNDMEKKELDNTNTYDLNTKTDQNSETVFHPTFDFVDVQTLELKTLIRNIEIHKSSGIDGISSCLFKSTMKILFSQFTF